MHGDLGNYSWFVILRDALKKLISPFRVIHPQKGEKIPARNDNTGVGQKEEVMLSQMIEELPGRILLAEGSHPFIHIYPPYPLMQSRL